jgi:hypothetical protein
MKYMTRIATREVARRFRDQYGVITRSQLRAFGVGNAQVRRRLASGEWELLTAKVLRLAGSIVVPEQELLAACLEAGPTAMASHLSAAWLWRFAEVPGRHDISVARTVSARALGAAVHRPRDYPSQVVMHRRLPCTTPLRTVVDAAAVCAPDELEELTDRALAAKLVTLEGIEAELARTACKGRAGIGPLRSVLDWRRSIAPGQVSVLESNALRLLHRAGIKPVGVEIGVTNDLNYRVDIVLRRGLAMEVDGYAYHHSAAQMAEDARRRNRLFLEGTEVLVYTWRDIRDDGYRVVTELRRAMAQTARLAAPSATG